MGKTGRQAAENGSCRKESALAVFFPGIGYTVDKPLMHYCRRIAQSAGYEIRLLPYSGFPPKVKGDRQRMEDSYQIALRASLEMLSDIDLTAYERILFVGKSIGTIVAARIASESDAADRIRQVVYTPLADTFSFPLGDAVVFTGGADPWVKTEKDQIPSLCRDRNLPCFVIPDANHSLECGDIQKDLENMKLIMSETQKFVQERKCR